MVNRISCVISVKYSIAYISMFSNKFGNNLFELKLLLEYEFVLLKLVVLGAHVIITKIL